MATFTGCSSSGTLYPYPFGRFNMNKNAIETHQDLYPKKKFVNIIKIDASKLFILFTIGPAFIVLMHYTFRKSGTDHNFAYSAFLSLGYFLPTRSADSESPIQTDSDFSINIPFAVGMSSTFS